MFSSRGTVRYEERGQGYRDVEKIGKHCSKGKHRPWFLIYHHYNFATYFSINSCFSLCLLYLIYQESRTAKLSR